MMLSAQKRWLSQRTPRIARVSGVHVAVVDLKTPEVATAFTTGKDPDGMAWRK